jgi:DNA polymerase-3 subunit gamma/tau
VAKTKSKPKENDREAGGYTVVARRYRPQQFADLIGQEHVAQALTNAISCNRIAHAYLFTGARGVGKTSSARILAKALNCEKGPTATPCDTCTICTGIIDGADPDVLEIDGASNNKVDEVRELRNNVNFRPTRARFKIYIIDEVHMLSTGAFNALLKTLEEPPAHVKFILATTDVQKIPITILSRCQRYDFRHIGPNKVFETLRHIVAKEGLKAEDDALRIVARRAGGSMRDAQSLLDQLLAFSDGPLTAEKLHGLLGSSSDERIAELAAAILSSDAKRAVDTIADAVERGQQLGELLDQLIEYWRSLMLIAVGGSAIADVVSSPTLIETITNQAKSVSVDSILAGIDVLTTAKGRLRGSSMASTIAEAAVVRLCRIGELLSVNQLAVTVASGAVLASPSTSVRSNPGTAAVPVKKNDLTPPAATVTSDGKLELTTDSAASVWPIVIGDVGQMAGFIWKKAGLPAILAPNSLALRFDSTYCLEYDQASASSMQAGLVQSLKKVTGQDWSVRVELKSGPPGGEPNGAPEKPAASSAGRQKAILEHPLLKRIRDSLGGQMVRMEDGFNPVGEKPPFPAAEPDDGEATQPDGEQDPETEQET